MEIPRVPEVERHALNLKNNLRRKYLRAGVKKPLPRLLFKFCNPFQKDEVVTPKEKLKSVIVNNKLWFSYPKDFNDPFEFRLQAVINEDPVVIRSKVERMIEGEVLPKGFNTSETVAKITTGVYDIQKTYDKMAEIYGVTCFTINPFNIRMWSHYASSHQGVCYVYSPERDLLTLAKALPVNYTDVYPIIKWPNENKDVLDKLILSKSTEWGYENEYRIFGDMSDGIRSRILNASSIRAVIIGAKATDQNIGLVIDACNDRLDMGYEKIKIFRALLSKNEYKLKFEKLSY